MKKDYNTPELIKTELEVTDIITASTAVDDPTVTPGEYRQVGDFATWFGTAE